MLCMEEDTNDLLKYLIKLIKFLNLLNFIEKLI